MDRRVNRSRAPWPGGWRRGTFAAVVAVVVLLHLGVTSEVAGRMADADPTTTMPARIEIAYVKTLELEEPAPAATGVAPPLAQAPAAPRAAHVPRKVVAAASAASDAERLVAEAAAASASAAAAEAAAVQASAVAEAASASRAATGIATATAASDATTTASATASASAPASGPAGFVWPRATRVSYILNGNYRGDVNGRAEVEWIRTGQRYQVNVDLYAGPTFAPILSRKMTSEGAITDSGLAPDRYDEDTQVLFRDRRRMTVTFAPDAITLGNGQKREPMAGVQDTASQFIQFTWLFGAQPEELRVGNVFEFPLALPRSMKRWTYDVTEQETLYTPFGALTAYHLKPRLDGRKPGDITVEMWFAPELRFLPVRIRIEQDPGTYLDLLISKKPEIADS